MRPALYILVMLAIAACGEQSAQRPRLGAPARIKVYLNEGSAENNCDGISTPGTLVSETLGDFETDGFANVQVGHVPAYKKLFFIVTATDPVSGVLLGHACTQSFEVGRGGNQDLHITLNSPVLGNR